MQINKAQFDALVKIGREATAVLQALDRPAVVSTTQRYFMARQGLRGAVNGLGTVLHAVEEANK